VHSGGLIKAVFRQCQTSKYSCVEYLLDTDTCVDLLRNVPAVIDKMRTLAPDDCGISVITSFELFAGAARARDPRREAQKVQALVDVVEEVSFTPDAARRAGLLRFELETAGTPIGAYDLLIASHALVLDLTLVTANAEEFGHVPGLPLETWR
jgi:tRNA(fMet)-specific endonuclease VapC